MLEKLLLALWLLLPAYTPNNFAVITGGGKPIDLGKNFFDQKRIFGDGKTFRGFFGGVAGGVLVANVQYSIEKFFNLQFYSLLNYSDFFILTLLLAFGAMLGDLIGSFIKRRFGYKRGEMLPVFDQLTFLFVSLAIASTFKPFWYLFDLEIIVVGILITPIAHISANIIAYKLRLKDVPW